MLSARLTKYDLTLLTAAVAGALILATCRGAACLISLGVVCTLAGLTIGLGVSFPQWSFFGPSLCRVRTSEKVVALTFDDGPDPTNTAALLDLLARRSIRATFFCIGERLARHPEVARRIVAEGHIVENHTHRHRPWTNLLPTVWLRKDVQEAQAAITRVVGRTPVCLRTPMGLTNPRVFPVARELNLRVTGYSARGLDRRGDPPEQIVARLLSGLQPGAILLLHDGGVPAERMLAVVTMLIDKIEAQGYRCLRLDELIQLEENA